MAPLPLLGPSSPPLRFRKPRPPPPGLSYLKLPGKSRRRRGIRRPLPSSAGPGGSRGPAPPLGYAGSSPSADHEAPDPTSPRNVEPRAPHLRPRFPLPCDTGPHPGIQGQKGTFPGSGFSSRRWVAAVRGAGPGADSAACRPRGKACVAGPLRDGSASSSSEPRYDLAPARRNLSFSPMSLV